MASENCWTEVGTGTAYLLDPGGTTRAKAELIDGTWIASVWEADAWGPVAYSPDLEFVKAAAERAVKAR